MKQRIFCFGLVVFFVLGCFFSPFVLGDFAATNPKVQVKVDSVCLSSDGGATWGEDILGGASSYIEIEPGQTAGEIIGYFKQGAQVAQGTYNKIKIVLNSVVKIYFEVPVGGGVTYYPVNASFNQSEGILVTGGSNVTDDPAQAGWWDMTLTSGYETIITDFLDSSGNPTTLSVSGGATSTIRVEVYNQFNVLEDYLGITDNISMDANPGSSTGIYVQ